jgi:AbrB family looped-hinge helix DNA binding protein
MGEDAVEATVVGQSKITARGQVTLPKELRKKYGMKAGETLYFLEADGTIVLKLGPLVITE